MKKGRAKKLVNLTLFVAIALIMLTPLGFYPRVFVSRLLSFSPTIIDEDEQLKLAMNNWELERTNDEVFNFNSLNNKVVLINFWATWCPPCVAEMPSLNTLYQSYGDRVEFMFVAHDDKKKVLNYLTDEEYDFPVYFERSTPPKLLESKSIPTTYIIDADGNIVVKKIGAAKWDSKKMRHFLDQLLEKK